MPNLDNQKNFRSKSKGKEIEVKAQDIINTHLTNLNLMKDGNCQIPSNKNNFLKVPTSISNT